MVDRTLLFVPGSRPERFNKALAAGAGAVIIDLEDAVAPAEKENARVAVKLWLTGGGEVILRVNGWGTRWFEGDLSLAALPGVRGIMVPKVERPETIEAAIDAGARVVYPLIETASGFASMPAIAASPGVRALVFGSIDFQLDLGMRGADEGDLLPYRTQFVLASRVAGIEPPVDGVTMAIDDESGLRKDALRARRLGFGGKLCIHPRQVSVVEVAYAPDEQELAWARRVVDAAEDGAGQAIAVDGYLVDKPVLLRARAILRDVRNGN